MNDQLSLQCEGDPPPPKPKISFLIYYHSDCINPLKIYVNYNDIG